MPLSPYGFMHDRVKHAVAARLRSFMTPETASFSVLLEQPMRSHFNLKNSNEPEGISRFADLIVSMTASVQQEIVACDFVSCLPKGRENYDDAFLEKSQSKRRVYSRYAMPPNSFYPLPFGRTNALSKDVFDFCLQIARYFPKHMRVDAKLRASFGRAIYVGAAQTFNLSLRRLQLAATQDRSVVSVPFPALLSPYVEAVRPRRMVQSPCQPVLTQAALFSRLAAALADYPLATSSTRDRFSVRRVGLSSVYGLRSSGSRGSRLPAVGSGA